MHLTNNKIMKIRTLFINSASLGVNNRKYKMVAQTIFSPKFGRPAHNLVAMGYWATANFYSCIIIPIIQHSPMSQLVPVQPGIH